MLPSHPTPEPVEEDQPEVDEIEIFWLSVEIVTSLLLYMFVSAAKTGNWEAAATIVERLGGIVGLHVGADWVMAKIMK